MPRQSVDVALHAMTLTIVDSTHGENPYFSGDKAMMCTSKTPIPAQVCRSDQVNPENPARRGTVEIGPARMNASVATDQSAIAHRESVRIARARRELRDLQYSAGRGVIFHQRCASLGIALAVVPDQLPNGPVVPCDGVVAHHGGRLIDR